MRIDRARRGVSLTEVLIVISILAVLLASSMLMAQTLLRADRDSKSALVDLQRLNALADRFREDAHWAERAAIALPSQVFAASSNPSPKPTPGHSGGLDFARGDRIVEYRLLGDAIERTVLDQGARKGREVFILSGHPQVRFLIDEPNPAARDSGMASVVIERRQGREQEGRRTTTRIEAALAQRGSRLP